MVLADIALWEQKENSSLPDIDQFFTQNKSVIEHQIHLVLDLKFIVSETGYNHKLFKMNRFELY